MHSRDIYAFGGKMQKDGYSCSFYYFLLLKKTGEPGLELVWTVDIRYCPVLFHPQ